MSILDDVFPLSLFNTMEELITYVEGDSVLHEGIKYYVFDEMLQEGEIDELYLFKELVESEFCKKIFVGPVLGSLRRLRGVMIFDYPVDPVNVYMVFGRGVIFEATTVIDLAFHMALVASLVRIEKSEF